MADSADAHRVLTFLDEAEKRVEAFRTEARYIQDEQASLLSLINKLNEESLKLKMSESDREQFHLNLTRIKARCASVEVTVNTIRDESQENALGRVNSMIDRLLASVHSGEDKEQALAGLHHCFNACLPDARGHVDHVFQNSILQCAVDDQKNTRRRLERLIQELSSNHRQ